MKASRLIYLLLALSFFSCQQRKKEVLANYVETVSGDGLTKHIEAGEWVYEVKYRPAEYILIQENHGSDTQALEARRKQLTGTAWFNITISRKDGAAGPLRYQTQSQGEYEYKYNYYLNEASKQIHLFYGQDTIAPLSYVFETSYNVAPQETIVVGFLLPPGEERPIRDMQLVFKDALLNTGIIKAFFSKQNLLSIPQYQ